MVLCATVGLILRVFLFIVVFVALLRIKKTRLRHLPTRRTRISRHHGVPTLWLERLVNAILDMVHESASTSHKTDAASTGVVPAVPSYVQPPTLHPPLVCRSLRCSSTLPVPEGNSLSSPVNTIAPSRFVEGESGAASCSTVDDADGCDGNGPSTPSQPNNLPTATRYAKLIAHCEEWVNAKLEDGGIATWADFRIHSLGSRPPRVKAIHVTHTTPNKEVGKHVAGSTQTPGGGVGGSGLANGGEGGYVHTTKPGTSDSSQRLDGDSCLPVGSTSPISGSAGCPTSLSNYSIDAASSSGLLRNVSTIGNSAALELELEVEYSGDVDVSLQADLSVARGRQLPVHVRVSNVKYIRAHMHAVVVLQIEEATLEAPRKPYVMVTVWLESDPTFDMTMNTSLTRFNIRDVFVIPLLAKFFLLRFVRSRLNRSLGAGLQLKVPLPEDIVDGGDVPWCGGGVGRDGVSDAGSWFR